MEIVLFLITAMGFTLIPGPNATLIVATSVSHTTKKGLQCALGVSSGVAVHLCIALLSTQWFLTLITESINWTMWMIGLAALYLVVRLVFSRFRSKQSAHLSGAMSYSKGLGLSLSNPKGIIFFAAFIPHFINKSTSYWPQALTFCSLFLLVSTCGDMLYAIFAGKLSKLVHSLPVRRFFRKHRTLAKYRFRGWLSRW